jgi:hypothetical protein
VRTDGREEEVSPQYEQTDGRRKETRTRATVVTTVTMKMGEDKDGVEDTSGRTMMHMTTMTVITTIMTTMMMTTTMVTKIMMMATMVVMTTIKKQTRKGGRKEGREG